MNLPEVDLGSDNIESILRGLVDALEEGGLIHRDTLLERVRRYEPEVIADSEQRRQQWKAERKALPWWKRVLG